MSKSIEMRVMNKSEVNKKNSASFPLCLLHPELIVYVMAFLEARQLLDISQTCKLINSLYNRNIQSLWRNLSFNKWNFQSPRKDLDWRNYYFERSALAKEGSFQWTLMDDSVKDRPVARMCHTGTSIIVPNKKGKSCPDSPNSVVYIGGQSGQTSRFDDVIVFDGKKFVKHNQNLNNLKGAERSPGSPNFSRHTSVPVSNKVYSFGGFDGVDKYFDVAVFDQSNLTWSTPKTKGEAPKLKTNHAAASIGSKMYIYGGNRTEGGKYMIFDDLHVFDTDTLTWSQPKTTGDQPGPRVAHKMVAVGRKLYLFGGGIWEPQKDWIERTKKIHILDTDTMVWSCAKTTGDEKVRVSSFTVPLVFSHFIFFFGGQSIQDGNEVDDLISFDTVSHTWTQHTPVPHKDNPKPRSVGTLNFIGEHAWLFAGSDSNELSSSVHRLSHIIFKSRRKHGLPQPTRPLH
jgi:hypothetical protein